MRDYGQGLVGLMLPDWANLSLKKFEAAKRTLRRLLLDEVEVMRAQCAFR
jgi:hypothetical protein